MPDEAAHQEMEPVGHLLRVGCPLGGGQRKGAGAVAADYLDAGMRLQSGGNRGPLHIRQQVHDPMGFQVDEDGAIAAAFAPGPFI